MTVLEAVVGLSLLLLTAFSGETNAVLPYVAEYTPQVVKPLFDHMREYAYGSSRKPETKNENCGKNQFLIAWMVSHEEIVNSRNNGTYQKGRQQLEHRVSKRINQLPNREERSWAKYNCDLPDQGQEEGNFLQNEMAKFEDLKRNGPSDTPVLLVYFPCTDFVTFGKSCWELLGISTTIRWEHYGVIIAFSQPVRGRPSHSGKTHPDEITYFMKLAGIPMFWYQDSSKGEKLIEISAADNANSTTRWRSVAFLPVFFDCLLNNIVDDCLSDRQKDKRAIVAFFVNHAAYQCFRDKDYRWRRKRKINITECFSEYFDNNMGSDCKLCAGVCAASKKTITQTCLSDAFDKTLVPGAPLETFDPFNDAWRVTGDITLTKIFPDSPQNRRSRGHRKHFCKDRSLSLESLCSVSACNGTSPKPGFGFVGRLSYYCCNCFRG